MLMEKWRFFCEGRLPSAQVYTSAEPPDALAPGPFAPALPPGAPIVQPVLPPSASTQQALPLPGTSGVLATGPAIPQLGAGLPLAGSLTLAPQQTPPQQQLPQLAQPGNISPTMVNVSLSQVASHGGVGMIGCSGIPVVPGALATGSAPLQNVHIADVAGHPAAHPLVQNVASTVLGPVQAQQPPPTHVVVHPTTVVNGAFGHHGGLVTGPPTLCESSGKVRPGIQPGRRRQRARPQGRRL